MKNWNPALPVLLLVSGLLVGCGHPDEPKATTPLKAVQAEILPVQESTGDQFYVATGTVRSLLDATLSSKVMGRVVAVQVREGDSVKQGQLLVALDDRELQASANMAEASYHASQVGVGNASTVAEIAEKTSAARISQAESQVRQTEAALAAAEARRDMAKAGPRTQEVTQSHLAVTEAQSSLNLASKELERTTRLVNEGVVARRELELVQNRYDVAKGQYDVAVQSENMAREGSRSQDIRAAEEGVRQAQAAVTQAKASVAEAKAAALQALVRKKEVESAQAQAQEAAASLESAQVGLSYARVLAPFDGRVVRRFVDPGAMASPGSQLLEVEGGGYRLEASVPESVLKSLSVGDSALVQIDALKDSSIQAKVVEIVPKADAATHSFLVKLSLPASAGVKAGMYGSVKIRQGTLKQIQIPDSATWERDGLHYVFALDTGDIAHLRIVTVSEPSEGHRVVLSGLNSGDRIVKAPLLSPPGGRDSAPIAEGVKVEAPAP